MKLLPYPAYKPSGVEWLGDMPEHWDLKRLKFVFPRLFSGVSVNSDNSPTMDESPGILKTSCVYGNRFRPEENKRVLETELDRVGCPVTRNSLIISRMNTPELVGSCGYVESDFSHLFLPDRLWIARFQNHSVADGKFSWYLTISHAICALTASLATGTSDSMKNLTQEAFLDISVGVPPPAEQRSIAAFLDRETGRVDRLVAKKRELIERLKEKRTALISRTVTCGLPAEVAAKAGLPSNPPLKPSALDWLVDIPKHWEEMTIKRVALSMICGPFGSSLTKDKYTDSGYRVYGQEQVIPGDFSIGDYYISTNYFSEMKRYEVRAGDVLVSCVGTFGKAAVVPEDIEPGIINPRLILIRPDRRRIDSQYMGILIRSHFAHEQLQATSRGGTMDIINLGLMGDLMIPLPPLPEQAAIAAYLDEETAKLDALVGKVEEAVERLQEYRTALITAAVTGKIDVRNIHQTA